MSDDTPQELRHYARYDAPLRRRALIHRAADEIERLRARVEVLELIRRYMSQGVSWDRAEEKAIDEIEERKARAKLEVTP